MERLTRIAALLGVLVLGFLIGKVPKHIHGQTKTTPLATTGIPSPMLYDSGDPVSLSYPCDTSHMGVPFYNLTSGVARPIWLCNGTAWLQALPAITGTTVSIGGSLLAIGGSASGSATVTGAAVGSVCIATPSDGSMVPVNLKLDCSVATANTATVRVSAPVAAITPTAVTYTVRILQ